MPPKTAIAAALDRAGYDPPEARLDAIADAIVARKDFQTREAMAADVARQVGNDPVLIWALFAPFQNKAIGALLEEALKRRRIKLDAAKAKSGSGAILASNTSGTTPRRTGGTRATGPTPAQRAAATQQVNRALSMLDQFIINGKPIGDCTPEEALGWRASRVRDARYVWLICAGIPHGQRIRNYIKPEESNALYERAAKDTGNE